ncbi:MAG: thioredoxin family protein [Kordia sp.]|uniref:thioredoxin family protein n=1 Tax=Kordia sp. TaxID=1965332 RepID=UPI003859B06E
MKKHILIVLSFFLCTSFIFAQEWQTNFEAAKEMASDENKPIILVFQGSDWCAPCIKLDKEIWSTDSFKAYAKDHYILLQADFPRRKKNKLSQDQTAQNAKLAEKYNKNGIFPFVVILDSNGKVLGQTGYKKIAVADYIETINSFVK